MTLILYLDLLSQPCRALYITLKLHGIPFQPAFLNISKGEHLTEEFTQNVSRFKKLPVINDDGFKLTESVAILRYLAKTGKLPENYYSQNPQKQARIDEYLEWHHNNTREFCSAYFARKWIFPKLLGKIDPPERLKLHFDRMTSCLDNIERLWLSPGPFVTGSDFTAADIWAACEIEQLIMTGYDPRIGRPKLTAFFDGVRALANPYYDEAHKQVYRLAEKEAKKAKL